MAMMHMGFVHAALVDVAADGQGKSGSSWDRELRYAQSVVETMSVFDGRWEGQAENEAQEPPTTGFGGGWRNWARVAFSFGVRRRPRVSYSR